MESNMGGSQKIKNIITLWSCFAFSMYSNELKSGSQRDMCTPKFTAALFTIVKRWQQSKCSSTDRWIMKMCCICACSVASVVANSANLCSPLGSLSMEFSRQEDWSGLPWPPPEDLPKPGIEPMSPAPPALQVDSLPLRHQRSPTVCVCVCVCVYLYRYIMQT